MKTLSNTEYQELRNKLWSELYAGGLMDDSNDGEYEAFDKILGEVLPVDWGDEGDNPVAKAVKTLEGLSDILETDLSVDWEMTDPTTEFKLIGKIIKKVKEDLESNV